MAVAFDAVATDSTSGGNLSFSHTATGSNIEVFLFIGQRYGTGGPRNPTYDGALMTSLFDFDNGNLTRTAAWRILIPTGAGSAKTIVANVPTGDTARPCAATAISFTGVDQVTPQGTIVGNPGHDAAPQDTVASAVNDMVVDFLSWYVPAGEIAVVGAGQTQRSNLPATGGGQTVGTACSTAAGAASVVMDWETRIGATPTATYWNHVAIPIKAGGAAPGGSPLSAALQFGMGDGG